jgi:Right handed beta helix region
VFGWPPVDERCSAHSPSLGLPSAGRDVRPDVVSRPLRGALAPAAAALVLVACLLAAAPHAVAGTTIRVPEDYSTIQAAVDAASSGDVIDVAPGTFRETITIDRSITLRGRVYDPARPGMNTTIVDGGGSSVITIASGISPRPVLIGLIVANGDDGITTQSPINVKHSYFVDNEDSLDYEIGGGGLCLNNVFVASGDDAVDFDHLIADVRVANNRMVRSADDGVEIRLHDDEIPRTVQAVIRNNEIIGSDEDGIQIIDYFEDTNRTITIARNLIRDSTMAGIGLMDNGETKEDLRAASIRERIEVFHNTLVDNDHGISGGDNLIALNNIFQGHVLALKRVDGDSVASFNLFWNNEANSRNSNVVRATSVVGDPQLDAEYHLRSGSPAVDAGTARFEWRGEVVMNQPPSSYQGAAPDIGGYERRQ